MLENLKAIREEAISLIKESKNLRECEDARIAMLGKKGKVTEILKNMKSLSVEEKKVMGKETNLLKKEIENFINEKKAELAANEKAKKLESEALDVTEPAPKMRVGAKHLITTVIDEVVDIFTDMGYEIVEGPLVDTVFNTFDGLNSPPNHPSRDMTDTFYISKDNVLRPHTSSVEIRTLQNREAPFKIVSPGRCFRCDTPDATHSPMFHQIEGMIVDEGITMAHLKGTLDYMAKKLFGSETKTKFRPHHFPFTEPSAEMDVSCFKCGGKGCSMCKGSGWIEILGCGMTHPNVHGVGNIDTEKYTGFAFGMGVERIAMLKYGIDDIRYFYENDMRFNEQFK